MNLIDLTHVIDENMPVYPGDTKTRLYHEKYLKTDGYNNFRLHIGMHAGTHIDSPMHLTDSTQYISELPLESFIGEGCILDVRNQPLIKFKPDYEVLIKKNSIVLLYTGFASLYGTREYYENNPCVDRNFCELLIKKNVKLLGMDMPSPDRLPFEIHKLLLKNNIYIIENLTNLDKLLDWCCFEVMAFPLKIKADSSIVRVIARNLK